MAAARAEPSFLGDAAGDAAAPDIAPGAPDVIDELSDDEICIADAEEDEELEEPPPMPPLAALPPPPELPAAGSDDVSNGILALEPGLVWKSPAGHRFTLKEKPPSKSKGGKMGKWGSWQCTCFYHGPARNAGGSLTYCTRTKGLSAKRSVDQCIEMLKAWAVLCTDHLNREEHRDSDKKKKSKPSKCSKKGAAASTAASSSSAAVVAEPAEPSGSSSSSSSSSSNSSAS